MKLAAIYNVFSDSVDLLPNNIDSIRDSVDLVVVVSQRTSNFGEIDEYAMDLCSSLTTIDSLIEYEPVDAKPAFNEKRKMEIGLDYARTCGVTHFLFLAPDEYYFPDEFEMAKMDVFGKNLMSSFCHVLPYVSPTRRFTKPEKTIVPFISKLVDSTTIGRFRGYPFYVDPTRQISPWEGHELFPEDYMTMHHMTLVRPKMRLEQKFNNSTARRTLKRCESDLLTLANDPTIESHSFYHGFDCPLEAVPDYFNLEEVINKC